MRSVAHPEEEPAKPPLGPTEFVRDVDHVHSLLRRPVLEVTHQHQERSASSGLGSDVECVFLGHQHVHEEVGCHFSHQDTLTHLTVESATDQRRTRSD